MGRVMRRSYLRNTVALLAALVMGFGVTSVANACSGNQQTCSSGFGVSEAFFGQGGSLCDPSNPSTSEHSTNYCAKTAIGETGVGKVTSGNQYQAQAGFNTDRYPSLTLLVNDSSCQDYQSGGVNLDLGILDVSATKTTNGNFSVKTYLASGYNVTTS